MTQPPPNGCILPFPCLNSENIQHPAAQPTFVTVVEDADDEFIDDEEPEKTSSYRGVFWDKSARQWSAKTHAQNQTIFLGLHHQEIDAARAGC